MLGWYEYNDPRMLLEGKASNTMAATDIVNEVAPGKSPRSGRIKRMG